MESFGVFVLGHAGLNYTPGAQGTEATSVVVSETLICFAWAVLACVALMAFNFKRQDEFLVLARAPQAAKSRHAAELEDSKLSAQRMVSQSKLSPRITYDEVMSGQLYKQRETLRWSWSVRHLVLSKDGNLYLYHNKQDQLFKAKIKLSQCQVQFKYSKSVFVRLKLSGLGIGGGPLQGGKVLRLSNAESNEVIMNLSADRAEKLEEWFKAFKSLGVTSTDDNY